MNYFITGGLGLIGSQIANTLQGQVTILSRSLNNKQRLTKKATIIQKDLLKISSRDLSGTDIIYHCASTVHNYHVLTDPHIDIQTNLTGTITLLEAVKNLKKKPVFVYLSTFFVYGNTHDETKKSINEKSSTDPLAIYPATKLCAESIIKLYGKLYNIPYRIVRLTNVYGEHESFDNKKKGALNFLIMQAVRGEKLNIYRGGNFYRDYIYVDDVVSALMFLEKKQTVNEIFLIGFGKPVYFKELITHLHNVTGNKSLIEEIEPPEFHKIVGIRNFKADTSKINNLGWKAKIDYKEGIERIVNYYKSIV
jgi:nucleoside-diphosphate-sugar epimerase